MKVKLTVSIILLSVAGLFVYQNTDLVAVDFLTWSVDVSLALLVLCVFAVGLAIGWLMSSYLRFSRNRKKMKKESMLQDQQAMKEAVSTSSTAGEIKSDEP
jgi:uncharacterized membrane protein YciS (DUF1049 family)